MKKRTIAGLIAAVVIAVAVMFSGCVEKELGSIGGVPAINNPEDVVKAYFYYFTVEDYKKAYGLSVDPRRLEPYPEKTIDSYVEAGKLPPGWKVKYEIEILNKSELSEDEEWQYHSVIGIPKENKIYKITYLLKTTGIIEGETIVEQDEGEMFVIKTNEGWRLLGLSGLGI